jgi:hypothetical protein
MKDIWATLIAPILVAIFVGYFIGREGNATSEISADISWIQAPNPLISDGMSSDSKDLTEEEKEARSKFRLLIDQYKRLDVAAVKISNNSERVSKPIKAYLPDGGIFMVAIEDKQTFKPLRELSIEALNPGESQVFLAVLSPSYFSSGPNVLITHDGLKVAPSLDRTPEHLRWPVNIAESYPFLLAILAPLMVLSFVLILLIPAAIYADKNIDFKARTSSRTELQKMKKLLAYVAEKYPEKLSDD